MAVACVALGTSPLGSFLAALRILAYLPSEPIANCEVASNEIIALRLINDAC